MSASVSLQENQESIIERWKASSPFEQGRLETLKQVIEEGKEQELYDPEEQRKFGLEKDEFLAFASPYGDSYNTFFSNKVIMPISWFGIINYFIDTYFISYSKFMPHWLYNIYIFFLIISAFAIVGLALSLRGKGYIFLTNRNIYLSNSEYCRNDKYRLYFFKEISLYFLYIKYSTIRPSYTGSHSSQKSEYKNLDNFKFILDLQFTKFGKTVQGMNIGNEISSLPYIKNKKYKNRFYILEAISYISSKYNIPVYISPIYCSFTRDKIKYVHGTFCYIEKIVYDIIYNHFFSADINIEQKFSTKIDLERYLLAVEAYAGYNKENVLSLLRGDVAISGEICRVVAEKKNVLVKKYDICFSQKNVWIELNGKKVSKEYMLEDIKIYDSNKYFVLLFPYNKKIVPYYAWKIDIYYPFMDIMELLTGKKMESTGSQFIVWES